MLVRGAYRIVRKLGKGGMGAVYLAHHTLMDEPRALQFLSQELSDDENFTGRFLREVRALRQVRNENVVDCGDPERAEDGSLFFPMEFEDGPTLRDFLKTAPRPFDVRLAIDITRGIAEGLGAAHSKGIIHRDIKPANILMAREGGQWVPKIVDFGIVATKENSRQTRTGSMMLTMAYAAPEQWIGTGAADLDGRTDLYALGGVLFERLVGHTVFEAENYHGWAQKHLNAPPAAPSVYRRELANWRGPNGGLDALVLRLLAKDVNQRPQHVAELLTLLRGIVYDPGARHGQLPPVTHPRPFIGLPARSQLSNPPLSNQCPAAHSSSQPQLGPSASAAAPLLSTPGAAGNGAKPLAGATPSRAVAEAREEPAYPTMSRAAASTARASSRYEPARKTTRKVAPYGLGSSGSDPRHERTRHTPMWLWGAALVMLVAAGFEAKKLYEPQVKFNTFRGQSGSIVSVAFSPGGRTLASAARDNTIQFWDILTRKPLNQLQDHVDAIAFSSDGRSLASADWDKNVQIWSVASGQVLATMTGHTGQVFCVAFSPDGRLVASGSADGTVKLWDAATGRLLFTMRGHTCAVNAVAFAPDGHTLASGSSDGTIILWDPVAGKAIRTLRGHTGAVRSVAFSPDGAILASGSTDGTIQLWNVAGGTAPCASLEGRESAVNSVAFNEDGTLLASSSADTTIRLWDMTTVRK